ncbi:sensor histidine kinase [uncultured Polaribacter sp.]|uniref:sensor histidine kinase n=1 Tax=uncultured Polaribacter sp. TaxID=174711 RepID=UPI002620D85B|nr:histidine kinase [uncultured Polaribacter sp.]
MKLKFSKSDYIILSIFYGVSVIMELHYAYKQNHTFLEYIIDIPAGIFISIILIYFFIFWLIPEYIINNKNYFLFGIVGTLLLFIFGGINYTIGFWTGANDWNNFPTGLNFILKGIDYGSETIAFPLGILLTKKFYEGRTELLNVEKQQKENELKLLRSQIDPHFLFNNLNTLDSLIDSNPNKAKEYINRLSLIYRYLIQTKDAEVMELSKELNFSENYIFLIKTRFENDYEFNIEKNTEINNKFIPTGALQALLENVVKHNKVQNNTPVKILITINDGWLTVTNTKSKTHLKEESFGTGLKNLKARYKLLSDEKIQVHNLEEKFEVFIPIITLSE